MNLVLNFEGFQNQLMKHVQCFYKDCKICKGNYKFVHSIEYHYLKCRLKHCIIADVIQRSIKIFEVLQ